MTDLIQAPTVPTPDDILVTGLAARTRIATREGEMPASELRLHHRLLTRDEGDRAALRIFHDSAAARPVRGVRIAAGALGQGLPHRDLTVAEASRLLLTGDGVARLCDTSAVLARAGHLVGRPGIGWTEAPREGWIALSFRGHALILADGIWTETEPMRLAGAVPAPPVRRVLTRIEAQLALL